ncbi:MAG: cobalamin-binding protein [Alphaproteobacteria bacterium]|nr:cobalamin-binding protein [Alphaproteobacteria bacterium]
MEQPRIVSLIASATEIIAALGFESDLVGRSHECDWPPGVVQLPALTRSKLNIEAPSATIDREVKALLEQALSVYEVDASRLRDLAPDVIVTQTQCEVCAVSLQDVEQAVCDWIDGTTRIVPLAPNALADVWTDVINVATALDAAPRGVELTSRLQGRMAAIAARAATASTRPRVACIEWIDPLMAAGNWVPELVDLAGGVNLFGEAGRHAPWMAWDQLASADPDIIVMMPCGFDIARSRQEMLALTARPGWRNLKAVRAGQVFVTDGNQYFNRPGPRLVESLAILVELLHPRLFPAQHTGTGWQQL